MKEDVLEQIVDDYLQFKGYFTTHNVRFRPRLEHPEYEGDQDRVPSDVDVVGIHPGRDDVERVIVVTCKSWQAGFNPRRKLEELRGEAPTSPKLCRGFTSGRTRSLRIRSSSVRPLSSPSPRGRLRAPYRATAC